jgi:hypothetical protein
MPKGQFLDGKHGAPYILNMRIACAGRATAQHGRVRDFLSPFKTLKPALLCGHRAKHQFNFLCYILTLTFINFLFSDLKGARVFGIPCRLDLLVHGPIFLPCHI